MSRYVDIEPYDDCRIVLHREDPGIPVSELPTADVREVRHGKWIRHINNGSIIYECSECVDEYALHNGTEITEIHYCPSCGAIMDGKEIENVN